MSLLLYQFPISHFCEKIRWALDYKGLEYQTKNLLPGLHLRTTRKITPKSSVPILVHGGTVIQDSHVILDYLDEHFPDKPLRSADAELREEMFEWEMYLDAEVGVHIRRYCYHILLDDPHILLPFFTQGGPWWSPFLFKLVYAKLEARMRRVMKIDEAGACESREHIETALDRINARLKDQEFLVGEQFSRVDLTAAALLAPLFTPDNYGLAWPERAPPRLQAMMDANSDKLEFARRLYTDYR